MASFVQIALDLDTKQCPICKVVRLRSEFHRQKDRKDGLCYKCKVCVRAYYDRTREHQLATARKWQRAHPDRQGAAIARWNAKNPEKVRAIRAAASARYVKRNPDYYRAKSKEYREAVKNDPVRYAQERERQRLKWQRTDRTRPRKRNPDARKAAYHRYRSRLKNAEGKFTAAEWIACKEAHGNVCAICGEAKKLCADHIIPISKGGSNYITNIQPLCFSCNSRKRDKMPHELKGGDEG